MNYKIQRTTIVLARRVQKGDRFAKTNIVIYQKHLSLFAKSLVGVFVLIKKG